MPGKGRPFRKGWKGGPGRPPGSGRIERCRKWADRYGLRFLEALAEGKTNKRFNIVGPVELELRKRTAEYLTDRGYGKTPQGVDVTSGDKPLGFTLKLGRQPAQDGDA